MGKMLKILCFKTYVKIPQFLLRENSNFKNNLRKYMNANNKIDLNIMRQNRCCGSTLLQPLSLLSQLPMKPLTSQRFYSSEGCEKPPPRCPSKKPKKCKKPEAESCSECPPKSLRPKCAPKIIKRKKPRCPPIIKSEGCVVRIKMPCCKESCKFKAPFCCIKQERILDFSCRIRAPSPSFYECIRDPIDINQVYECHCTDPTSPCAEDERPREVPPKTSGCT